MLGDDGISIAISDNGVGIAHENLDRIFSHGFSTRPGGHGFGLHSGANAAKEMGGHLSVRSEGSDKGATFTLELPLNPRSTPNRNEPQR
jgi:signal transduction histidine kinase